MPNGGVHREQVGVCPHCRNPRIRTRRHQHRRLNWRCRNCNRVFGAPANGVVVVEEWPGVDLVYLDRTARAHGVGSRLVDQGRRGNFGCGCLFIVIIIVGVASFFAISRNADFPGAQILRTAGQEVTQRLGGDGAGEEEPPPQVSTLTSTPKPASTRAAMSTPKPPLPPDQRHHDYKTYMLELINAERRKAAVSPVTLGDNIAAQLHAENSLANCFSGHWGVDGLKPYMRYSLAGGYQSNSENGSGSDYCIKASDRYRALDSIKAEIREMMNGWMNSPGHRRNILDQWHNKVNIGLAWDKYNISGYQHFEGAYVLYEHLPEITSGTLSLSGSAINGLRFSGREELGLQIYYDPPPDSLTRGQISRTYCYDSGLPIAAFRYPLTGNSFWTEERFTKRYSSCPDPYGISPGARAPSSPDEAHRFWQQAYAASQTQSEQTATVPWITASKWTARGTDFSVTAKINQLLSKYGPGVYTVLLWGEIGGEDVPISEYSIFHEMKPPDTYDPDVWK